MTTDIMPVVRKVLGINWRTTIGAFIPLLSALLIVATAIKNGELPTTDQLYVVGGALSLAWTAVFAKDRSVTGGSISNVTGDVAAKPVSIVDMTSAIK
jgi:tryptophan-rich sensory protein